MPTTVPPAPRRSQEERATSMRLRLIDATLESLRDVGYAATTTRRVAVLAGVSQGAQSHHFPRRVDLVAAALEHAVDQRGAAIRQRAIMLGASETEPIAPLMLLDLLWEDFSSPLFEVFVKVWVAAADDPELYDRMVPLERRLAQDIAAALPRISTEPAARSAVRMMTVLATLRGLALSRTFEPTDRAPRDVWPEIRPLLARILAG